LSNFGRGYRARESSHIALHFLAKNHGANPYAKPFPFIPYHGKDMGQGKISERLQQG